MKASIYDEIADEIFTLYEELGTYGKLAKELKRRYPEKTKLTTAKSLAITMARFIGKYNSREFKSLVGSPKYTEQGIDMEQRNIHEDSDGVISYSAKTEKPITSKNEAIDFWEIDTDKYEVKEFTCKSYDVTMKLRVPYNIKSGERLDPNVKGYDLKDVTFRDEDHKRTNYSFSLKLEPKTPLIIDFPKVDPFIIKPKKKAQMWVVVGCVHRPFHNKKLWNGLLNFLHDHKSSIHGIIWNGDYLDLRSLSSHDEFIPEGIDLGIEYSDGLKGIMEVESILKKSKKYFITGNHESRFDRDKKSVRKYGSSLQNPYEALRLHELGYKVQTDWKHGFIQLGNSLEVFHGVYHSDNAAKKHLDMIPEKSCIFNHTHRVQKYDNGNQTAYNCGWLGDINSSGFKYAPRHTASRWKNGFAIAYIDDKGDHSVNSIDAKNDKFFFGGKVYGG